MKHIAVAVFAVATTAAWATEPGQPLDCSDWVFLQPGLSCSTAVLPDCTTNPLCAKGGNMETDNTGRLLSIDAELIGSCGGRDLYRWRLEAYEPATRSTTVLAYVADRCNPSGFIDRTWARSPQCGGEGCGQGMSLPEPVTFDDKYGRVFVPMVTTCEQLPCCVNCPYSNNVRPIHLVAISGLATTFDILQSFTPAANTLGFRVPYMPEGLPAADHFDTYWGALTRPIDFSQAQGLACDYPAAAPEVGDYLEVADTLPAPAAGQGYWYLTAATYQGQRRFGRRTSDQVMSGRDPAGLPRCASGHFAAAPGPDVRLEARRSEKDMLPGSE